MDHLSVTNVKKANDACFSLEKTSRTPAWNFKSQMSQLSSVFVG